MRKQLLLMAATMFAGMTFGQITPKQQLPQSEGISPKKQKEIQFQHSGNQETLYQQHLNQKGLWVDDSIGTSLTNPKIPISPNGKLISVDGFEVDFLVPDNPEISSVCYTPRPIVNTLGQPKSAGCPFTVPCDNPANRDAATTTMKYFQLEWHVMQNTTGGASSNIDQVRIDQLMAELNADYASHNMVFCADPATFYVDDVNYYHDMSTEEVSLKTTYNVNPTQVINIYVVGTMSAGGYARFPYDPMGGTSATGGIVLARGNCNVGTHTLAHEMGHTFGLEHTFAGVDERSQCSACYEQVRNVNGSSNASGAPTPFGGPYNTEGDQEGDWCSDTNPHDTYSYNCSTSSNPNGGCDVAPWANAPVNNHMSYSFCSSQFTSQQSLRMHCMTDTYLGSWISYGGGICGAQPPGADFVGTPTTWQAPSNVNFTDLSQPQAIITQWTWVFDVGASGTVTCTGCVGANATYVGQTPPTVTYPNPGLYTVSLTVDSPNGSDTETKIDYIEVLAPAGDCDTLTTQWETPTPNPSIYTFGGGYLTGVQDPANSVAPTDLKGMYEMFFTPNPGVTQVGAVRVGLGQLNDTDDDMTFQVVVFDDDGFGAPGAVLGGVGGISPTQIGVPGAWSFNEFWIPLNNAVVPTTGTFHVGVEITPGDATDSMVVVSSQAGQGEGDFSNHIWTTGFGYENLQGVYGIDFDLDIVPMLGEWKPLPLITGFTETVVCDTTYVTLYDTVLYSSFNSMSITFADGTVINTTTDPMTIPRIYTSPGPDTVTITAINDCGRADTTSWIIPYGFLATPDAEFTMSPSNPICAGAPGVDFTANTSGYVDYTWDFGDGTVTSSGNTSTINHVYGTPGTYYVELTTTEAGYLPADTFYLEDFESGWPAGYDRYNNDIWTPDPAVNPPFDGTDATAWLPLDADGDGDGEAVSTSWNLNPGELADDWMLTTAIGPLPANQRLFWDAEALDPAYPDGYEVRISTTQLPANVANYSTVLFSVGAENAFNTTRSVDLSSYAGQTVYIAFRNNSDWQFLLSIDNIRIGTATPGCSNSTLYYDYVEVVDCGVTPPTAVLNADVTQGCNPLTVTFTDGTTLGDPADSWLWNFGDGTFSTVQNPPAHTYTAAGNYYVIFEACNAGGCTQDTVTIVVGDPPTISNVTTVDPTCAGNDGSIDITATGGTGALQYSIDNGVTFQAGNIFNGLGVATYDIVVEDALGCQATTSATLNAAPTPSITNVTTTDPTCNGGSDGTITITASGGTGALQYSINNGVTFQAGNNFTGLGAATYNIVVEDANGCQATTTATLTDPPAVSITNVATVDPTCNGATDGSITITASGGTGALQYSVDNGVTFQAGNIFGSLGAGTYDIVVEDANGCQGTTTATLTAPSAVNISNVTIVDPLCIGDANGSITITASGGTGALQYSIDNGTTFQAGNNFTGLGAATYDIVVEDANGCQATTTATLTDPPVVSITNVTTTDPLCNGSTNGTITITASGGTGALQYSIDNGATFQAGNNFTGLGAATYDIVVEDANGCQATTTATLTDPPAVSITLVTTTDPTCSGATDGDITITASGGTGALQYSIDNGTTFQAGNNFTGLGSATYNIVVEDANGCQDNTTATLTAPVTVSITNVTTTDPSCAGGSDGDITITASGGTGALQYSIDNGTTFQAGNNFTGLGAATYDIVVEDVNGCQATTTTTLIDPPAVSITNVTVVDPSCNGSVDGSLTITASGGTGALQYSIDNGVTFQAGNNFPGLGAATYDIVVEDANGCQATTTATLTDPPAVSITLVTTTDPTCAGGSDGDITITAAGGTGALQYSIDNGTTFQAGNNFPGLGAATYNIVVEDANGCQATTTATLTDPAAVTYGAVIIDETCGLSNGQIDLTGAGGDGGPYQYSIDGGTTFQASGTFPGLVAGPYNVVVEDGLGCQTAGIETVSGVGGPTITGINEDISLTCNGDCNGQLTATVTGGTLPYVYTWVDGTSAPVGGNSPTISALCADNYTLTVVDNGGAGCPAVMGYNLTEPAAVTYGVTITDESCGNANGQIDITGAAGGDGGPYQYSIDNGTTFQGSATFPGLSANTYDVVVEDASGCQATSTEVVSNTAGPSITGVVSNDPTCGTLNGDITITASGGTGALQYSIDNGVTFQAGNNFTGLGPATYDVVVEDANGCQDVTTVILTDPGSPTISLVTPTDPTCGALNGQIDITAAGGSGALQYSIDNGTTFQAGNVFTGLGPATYDIVVEDAIGCQDVTTVTLTDLGAPTITLVTTTDPTCGALNGQIDITAAGGTGALQYSIDNGVTFQAGNSFTGLGSATYDIVVEDANGCQDVTTATLTDPGAPSITAVTTTDPTCGNNDGQIDITASGGTGALQYSINNGVTFQAGNVFTGLGSATYDIVVEDANGCQATTTAALTDLGAPSITAVTVTDPTCGNLNGQIDITATGGTGALQYSVDNGTTFQAGNLFTGLGPAIYDIVVEDANGCQAVQTATLVDPGAPTITGVTTTDPTCGNMNGQINIAAAGGTGALQYSIDNGTTFQAGNSFTGLGPATYDIVVEDANGCQATTTATLTDPGAPAISATTTTDPTCGANNGQIDITAAGGTGALQYSVDNGVSFQAGNVFAGLGAATYDIVVEDANGCQDVTTVTLVDLGSPTITSVVTTDPGCGAPNGDITINASGGTGALQYSIDNGTTFQAGNFFGALGAATYNIVVEDANGCQATSMAVLTDQGAPSIDNVALTDPSCGNLNGVIDLTVSGGVPSYQYSIDNGTTFQVGNTFIGLGAGTYDVVVEDANGCQTNTTATLTNTPAPSIVVNSILNTSCFGVNDGEVLVTPTGGTAPYTFDWSNDGSGDFDDPEDISGLAPGVYSVTVQDVNGCTGLVTATVQGPSAALSASGTATDETFGNDGTIDLTVTGGTAPYTFDWDYDGTGDNNDPEDPTGLAAGTYTVTVTDINGCTTTTTVTVGSVVSLPEVENPMGVVIAPNPNSGVFAITFTNYEGDVTVDIIDVAGRLVFHRVEGVNMNGSIGVDLGSSEAGVYFVNVNTENGIFSTRVVKK